MRHARRSPAFVAAVVTCAAAFCVFFAITPAFATHDEHSFELDGNAVNQASAGVDWNTMFPSGSWGGAIAHTFVSDGSLAPPDTSYFTGGGSKDPNDVPDWAWTPGDVAPDKDEISDAFAVAYSATKDTGKTNAGDLLFAFGADRYANNGDAQIGFWFFRGAVGKAGGGAFSGTHTVGDILVLSDFTQGGRIGTVKVYRWVGSGGSDGSLHLIANSTDCADAAADDAVCAQENTAGATSPWPYVPKTGSANAFPQGAFFEGGLNVSRLVPGVRCFKSFMAETRSSQAIGAQLKDFALGPFDTCPRSPFAPSLSTSGGIAPGSPSSGKTLPATGVDVFTLFLLGFDLAGAGAFARLGAARRTLRRASAADRSR